MARVIIALMVVLAASMSHAQDPWFDTKVDYGVGGRPLSVSASDLDGDGDNDLAVANYSPDNVSVLINNGDGTFQTAVNYATGTTSYSVFAIDLDGDGDVDLAVANIDSDNVSILKNNGDGTFQPAVNYGPGDWITVFASDFDLDGDNDLALGNVDAASVSILMNNGDGTFEPAVQYSVGGKPWCVFASDLDGDGDSDLAIADIASDRVSVLKNSGDGTFQVGVQYAAGTEPISVFAIDVDGDGDNDLAVANIDSDNLSILKNNGDGTFQAAVNYVAGDRPRAVFAIDLDRDSDNDLVAANAGSDNVSILKNNGDGTFEAAVNFAAGDGPFSIYSSDLDSDGDNDLTVANESSNTVSIIMNLTALPHVPTTIRVPSDQPTIQAGVDVALNGDTVLVADGTYTGEGNRDVDVSGKVIVVRSENGPENTVIDCDASAADPHVGFLLTSGTTTIRGLTIMHAFGSAVFAEGQDIVLDSCIIRENQGAGVSTGSAILKDCVIEDNSGIGLYSHVGALTSCKINRNAGGGASFGQGVTDIDSCSFEANVGDALYFRGGTNLVTNCRFGGNGTGIGVWVEDSPIQLSVLHCEFTANITSGSGAGVRFWEGSLGDSRLVIDSCYFERNVAESGGAISLRCFNSSIPVEISRCRFRSNVASRGAGIEIIAGSCIQGLSIHSCVFESNEAQAGGAISGLYVVPWGTSDVTGCTFVGNSATTGSHIVCGSYTYGTGSPTISECVFADGRQGAAIVLQDGGIAPLVSCSNVIANAGGDWVGCIADQYGQNGNISLDPLFCDTANGNYSLYNFSPCAAANNSCGQLIGAYDVACTLAATLALPAEPSTTNVMSHTPVLGWTFDPALGWSQTEFEIAVGSDNDWAYAEMWNPAPSQSTEASTVYAGATLLDGATYYARVRTKLNGSWTPWYETSFRMNSLPVKPAIASPHNGAFTGYQPTLYVYNSTDPESDSLSYQFLLYDSPGDPSPLMVSDLVPQQTDSTGWTVSEYLAEDSIYAWRCRVWDGYEFSDTSSWFFFAVNGMPQAPSTPTAIAPIGQNLILFDMLPAFTWTAATDPDPFDEVRYRLELSLNQNFTMIVPFDNLVDTVFNFADSLSFSTRYWWRVKALDNGGLFSMSAVSDFWTWTLGDVNRSHDCTIGDIALLVDHLFIGGTPIDPPKVGDVNGRCDITIGDISLMIDHLFISSAAFKVGCE